MKTINDVKEKRKQEVANLAHDFFHLTREERLVFFDALGTLSALQSSSKHPLEDKMKEAVEDAAKIDKEYPFVADALNEIKEGLK